MKKYIRPTLALILIGVYATTVVNASCNWKSPFYTTLFAPCMNCQTGASINQSSSCTYKKEMNLIYVFCDCGGTNCEENMGNFVNVLIKHYAGTCYLGECFGTYQFTSTITSKKLAEDDACYP